MAEFHMRDPAGSRDRVQMEIRSSDGREKLQRERKLSGHLQDKMIWKTDPWEERWLLREDAFVQPRPKKTLIYLMEEKQLFFCSTPNYEWKPAETNQHDIEEENTRQHRKKKQMQIMR